MPYFHVSVTVAGGLEQYAVLLWGTDPALPEVRLVAKRNAQTQMLGTHVPAAIDRLLRDGYQHIHIEPHELDRLP